MYVLLCIRLYVGKNLRHFEFGIKTCNFIIVFSLYFDDLSDSFCLQSCRHIEAEIYIKLHIFLRVLDLYAENMLGCYIEKRIEVARARDMR